MRVCETRIVSVVTRQLSIGFSKESKAAWAAATRLKSMRVFKIIYKRNVF